MTKVLVRSKLMNLNESSSNPVTETDGKGNTNTNLVVDVKSISSSRCEFTDVCLNYEHL